MQCNGLLVVAVVLVVATVADSSSERSPTIALENQKIEIPFNTNETITLPCHGDGLPFPMYSWKKNGLTLDVPGGRFAYQPGSGNLVIRGMQPSDEGSYNCFASNKFGTAVGRTIKLKKAGIGSFPDGGPLDDFRPFVGDYLKIPCVLPHSYPKGHSYFGYISPTSKILENIVNDNRLLLDYDGNLHFANVHMNDSLAYLGIDIDYMCIGSNPYLGVYMQGRKFRILPQEKSGGPTNHLPQLRWPTTPIDTAVRGQTKRLKCIFSGLPTPTVTWHAENKNSRNDRFTVTRDGHGTEIELTNVDVLDAGSYTCMATNSDTNQPVSHTIHLTVETEPYWAKTPVDHYVDEGEDVEIDCTVHGTPQPSITWSINGVQVNELDFHDQRSLNGYTLRYENVTANDTQVVQCSSSNKHGTILKNIIVKVNAEEPSFIETPRDRKVVVGNTIHFECTTRGAPKPSTEWYRRNSSSTSRLFGNRFRVLDNGRKLEIKNTEAEDAGTYQCTASNKYGTNEATFELTVRSPTSITSIPLNRTVRADDDVTLPCDVTTDHRELANLAVEWEKDGRLVDFEKEARIRMEKTDFSLQIKSSKVKDTGEYVCTATNGLDSATSGISMVKVQGRPDAPYNVTIFQCGADTVGISWSAGNDNNDEITEFTIHYSGRFSSGSKTLSNADFRPWSCYQDQVSVYPWSQYAFQVTATNSIGTSDLSEELGQSCITPQTAPYRSPGGVCGSLSSAQQLVINWEPMPESEHNGEGFHYVVGYKKHGAYDVEDTQVVLDPKQKTISIHEQKEPFALFEVYVRAANKIGKARSVEKKLVRSGEGKPQVVPQNFKVVSDSVNGSFAQFSWDPVDTSEEKVRGFFRGYRIVFWKSDEPNIRRSEDVLIDRPFELCKPLLPDKHDESQRRRRHHHHRRHRFRSADRVYGETDRLWPLTDISAAVQVLNQLNAGYDSNVVKFRTPIGVPGKVSSLRVVESGWSHLVVEWQLPLEFTGDIIGYWLYYSVAPPAVGYSTPLHIKNPKLRRYKIRQLDYSTVYRISVTATTAAGAGGEETVIGETLPVNDPDAPKIRDISVHDDLVNVSWFHSDQEPPVYPGSEFFVKFRGPDNSTVVRKFDPSPDSDENWASVTGLPTGKYEVWVVASSGIGELSRENNSQVWILHIGLKNNSVPLIYQQSSVGWFVILMCIISLLLLLLLIFCIVRRTHEDVYPVYEKERMWSDHTSAPDETPFGEYIPPSELGQSQGSIDSDENPVESDSDSLGEYEYQEATKFNDEGSFSEQFQRDSMRPATTSTSE